MLPADTSFTDDGQAGLVSMMCHQSPKLFPCIFEYVYFARPDSTMNGVSVYQAQLKMGETRCGEGALPWVSPFESRLASQRSYGCPNSERCHSCELDSELVFKSRGLSESGHCSRVTSFIAKLNW